MLFTTRKAGIPGHRHYHERRTGDPALVTELRVLLGLDWETGDVGEMDVHVVPNNGQCHRGVSIKRCACIPNSAQ